MIPPRLSQLLSRWEEAYAGGHDLDPTELCPDEPELRASLTREIARLRDEWPRTLVTDSEPAGVQATLQGVTPTEAEAPRARVPGYDVESELGRGGMGVVYMARHLALNRVVALKMILHADHAGPEERLRFLGEAEAVAAV